LLILGKNLGKNKKCGFFAFFAFFALFFATKKINQFWGGQMGVILDIITPTKDQIGKLKG